MGYPTGSVPRRQDRHVHASARDRDIYDAYYASDDITIEHVARVFGVRPDDVGAAIERVKTDRAARLAR